MALSELFNYFACLLPVSYLVWYLVNPVLFTHLCVIAGLSIICWTVAYWLYERTNTETVSAVNKAVLVTGCDTGFGQQFAQRFDQLGFTVFAGVLYPEGEGATKLREACSSSLVIVKLDVTKQEDVEKVVREIESRSVPLWALVNNAGIAVNVPVDWGHDVEVYERVFAVNTFGLVRMTKNCLPLLRQAKGRIVNVTSAAARIAPPGMAHYCMSKHASRVFSDVARRELAKAGISLVVVEPTFYQTPINDFAAINRTRERIYAQTPDRIKEAYSTKYEAANRRRAQAVVEKLERPNVDEVVDVLEAAVTRSTPKLYYRCCGYGDILTTWAVSHAPEILLDWLIKKA